MNETYVYVLLSDGDGTMHSIATPFGVAVTTEEEAKRFVKKAKEEGWWGPSYHKVRIFTDKDEAIKWRFSK